MAAPPPATMYGLQAWDCIEWLKVRACMQAEEAEAMARRMVQVYADFATDVAAMPVVVGVPTTPSACKPPADMGALATRGCGRVPGGQTREACVLWLPGRKSRLESFAGANKTLTIEAMMGDRRALQVTQ